MVLLSYIIISTDSPSASSLSILSKISFTANDVTCAFVAGRVLFTNTSGFDV